ncbi:MAG: hypothetical protein SWH61_12185 [Thermodesulfobacteriota bacterium]|nr:hypothetical protein [Thermodesulfobacteriota bacterium]
MDLWVFATIIAFVLIGAIIVLLNRPVAILFIFLLASQFMGLVNPMAYAFAGFFDIQAMIAVFMALFLLSSGQKLPDIRKGKFFFPMLVFVFYYIYGVLLPIIREHSSLFHAVKASEDFIMIFMYFSVFAFFQSEQDIKRAWGIIIGFGIFYSLFEIIAQFAGAHLLAHFHYHFRADRFFFWKVYLPFFTVILIAFFYVFFSLSFRISNRIIANIILFFGLMLTFYRSYVLATIVSSVFTVLMSKRKLNPMIWGYGLVVGIVVLSILILTFAAPGRSTTMMQFSDTFFISGIVDFLSHSGHSLEVRDKAAADRKKILNQSPVLGFGFIDKESSFGKRVLGKNLLGFIDKGDLDLALKFGRLGAATIYLTVLYMIFVMIKITRTTPYTSIMIKASTLSATLLVYLLVIPVHGTLTYSFSLMPFLICLGLLEKEIYLLSHN